MTEGYVILTGDPSGVGALSFVRLVNVAGGERGQIGGPDRDEAEHAPIVPPSHRLAIDVGSIYGKLRDDEAGRQPHVI